MSSIPKKGTLGIIAGTGELPWIIAKNAHASGEKLRIFCVSKEIDVPEEWQKYTEWIVLKKFFSAVIPKLKKHNIDRVITIGKITRDQLYGSGFTDLRLLLALIKATSQSDYSLFSLVEQILKKHNIEILPQTLHLANLKLEEGRYGTKLSQRELLDVLFGLGHVRQLCDMDIGQTIVVGNRAILAVEAAEGSDACIIRGGNIFHGKGGVVCKGAKKHHDKRFDIPTVGRETLESMKLSKCRVLAIDEKCLLVVHPKEFLKKAKKYNISILSVNFDNNKIEELKKINAKK